MSEFLSIDERLKDVWLQTFGQSGLGVELHEVLGGLKVRRGRFELDEQKLYYCASMINDARTWTHPESGQFTQVVGIGDSKEEAFESLKNNFKVVVTNWMWPIFIATDVSKKFNHTANEINLSILERAGYQKVAYSKLSNEYLRHGV